MTDEDTRSAQERRLGELFSSVLQVGAPDAVWQRLRGSLSPEAVASRQLAWRRRFVVRAVAAVAASVLLVVGGWMVLSPAPPVETGGGEAPIVESPGPPPVEPSTVVLVDSDLDVLGEVHLVYEAGNVVSEELVLVTAGESYELW